MKTPALSVLPMCLIVATCGEPADSPTQDSSAVPGVQMSYELPTDEAIVNKIYDNNYQVPERFFIDERADTDRSYSLYHVKDQSASYELCTDDYSTAFAWEDADNERRSVRGYFVTSHENERYFEFVRELAYDNGVGNVGEPTSPGYARVFKCRYTNRDGVDRSMPDGYAGTLNMRPVSGKDLRTFTEYMWQFAFFAATRKKVLDSYSNESSDAFEHTLLLGFAHNQGSDRCDRIDVVEWTFSVNRSSGQLTKSSETVRSFTAELVGGVPSSCED